MAGARTYGPNEALAVREAEAAALIEAFEDGNSEVFAREAEAEPLGDEVELEIRELKEYMRKRVRIANSKKKRLIVLIMLLGSFQASVLP